MTAQVDLILSTEIIIKNKP